MSEEVKKISKSCGQDNGRGDSHDNEYDWFIWMYYKCGKHRDVTDVVVRVFMYFWMWKEVKKN